MIVRVVNDARLNTEYTYNYTVCIDFENEQLKQIKTNKCE